jgi:ligand-binding sensor domain-containing protein/signal transduction histidine kinase
MLFQTLVSLVLAWQLDSMESASARFQHISLRDGLSQSTVYCIQQDREGYLWFATEDGLNRYDGYSFTVFRQDPDDPTSLPSSDISAILVTELGILVGSWGSGLCLLDPRTGKARALPGVASAFIQVLASTKVGFCAGTMDEGLYLLSARDLSARQFRPLKNRDDSLADERVWAVCDGGNGKLYVGTNAGLDLLDPTSGVVEHIPLLGEAKKDEPFLVRSLFSSSQGLLWVGTENGLYLRDQTGQMVALALDDSPQTVINALCEDREGHLWVATYGKGLFRVSGKAPTFHIDSFPHREGDARSLSHADVRSLLQDKSGVLWIGTRRGGLNKLNLNHSGFSLVRRDAKSGLTHQEVSALLETSKGDLWVGTIGGGLNFFPQRTSPALAIDLDPHKEEINRNRVNVLLENGEEIWIGTEGGGLLAVPLAGPQQDGPQRGGPPRGGPPRGGPPRGEPPRLIFTGKKGDALASNRVRVLLREAAGRVWLGGRRGMQWLDEGGQLQALPVMDEQQAGLIHENVSCALLEEDGTLWVGTAKGLSRVGPGPTFQHFRHQAGQADSLRNEDVLDLYLEARRKLWIGSKNGLSLLDLEQGHFRHWSRKQGLPNDQINSILGHPSGQIWLSTNRGLACLWPDLENITVYSSTEGLQDEEFLRRSKAIGADGRLYFGGIQGFNHFDPERISTNTHIPNLVITAFRTMRRRIEVGPNLDSGLPLVLSSRENQFQIEFSALDFVEPWENRYRYQLVGFDPTWVEAGTSRLASYTNLPGGNYTFRVTGTNNNGIWNPQGLSLKIEVVPTLIKRGWFRLSLLLGLVAMAIGAHYWRLARISRHNAWLEQEVALRSTKLAEAQAELVAAAHKAGMAEIATGVLHNVGNVLNSVNVSTRIISDVVQNSKLGQLEKAAELLHSYEEQLGQDPKARKLIRYFFALDQELKREQAHLEKESHNLVQKLQLMEGVIAAQNKGAVLPGTLEPVLLNQVVQDALDLQASLIESLEIQAEMSFEKEHWVRGNRIRLIHVLINLIKNACESLAESSRVRTLRWECRDQDEWCQLTLTDNGQGMSEDTLGRLFSYGHTNKNGGHGFGLHSARTTLQEMGASILAESAGSDQGARFTLTLPKAKPPGQTN